MFNLSSNKFMKSMLIADVKGVAFNLLNCRLGITVGDSFYTLNDEGSALVNNEFSFEKSLPVPAFKMPLSNLSVGDIVVTGEGEVMGFAVATNGSSIIVVDSSGRRVEVQSTESMMGAAGVYAIKNISGDSSMMMLAMLGDDEGAEGDNKMDYLTMMLLSGNSSISAMQSGNNSNPFSNVNPMMLMLMGDDKGGFGLGGKGSTSIKDIMMMQALTGGGNMFGGQQNQNQQTPVHVNPLPSVQPVQQVVYAQQPVQAVGQPVVQQSVPVEAPTPVNVPATEPTVTTTDGAAPAVIPVQQ